jgi:hypothetical protein
MRIEPATIRLVVQCFNKLRYLVTVDIQKLFHKKTCRYNYNYYTSQHKNAFLNCSHKKEKYLDLRTAVMLLVYIL